MIGKLRGVLDSIEQDCFILDVQGVYYIIHASAKTLVSLPALAQELSCLIHMQVKEDDISLYGFSHKAEKEWFHHLILVQGIGPKLALVILSYLEPTELVNVIIVKDKDAFKQISGVGPKLAERIFTELAKKANHYAAYHPNITNNKAISSENTNNINDALVALVNLGYNKNDGYNICKKICHNHPDISINDLIKYALKELALL